MKKKEKNPRSTWIHPLTHLLLPFTSLRQKTSIHDTRTQWLNTSHPIPFRQTGQNISPALPPQFSFHIHSPSPSPSPQIHFQSTFYSIQFNSIQINSLQTSFKPDHASDPSIQHTYSILISLKSKRTQTPSDQETKTRAYAYAYAYSYSIHTCI